MQRTTILEAERLTKSFSAREGILHVVQEVSFSVRTGASCAIVGPSGSGKTTLLGLCAGLDLPTSGSVRLAGQPLETLGEDARAKLRNELIGFVFQNFQLIPTLTALENVMVPMELRGGANAKSQAIDLLRKVGLGDRVSHYPVQLSGGEQQRVALARAFINQPKILFADEPTGNLDSETSQAVVEALFELNREFGTTLVLVTHDAELAGKTDFILRLKRGRAVSEVPASVTGTLGP